MFPILYKYLVQHEQVCIPGVGIFSKQRIPAKLDFANKVFQPPVFGITFKEEPVKADKQFYAFVSKEQGVDEVEAIRHFHDFAYRFKDHLLHHNQMDLPGLGTLKKGTDGSISFEPEALVDNYFPATPAARIIRPDEAHSILVGDTESTNTEMQLLLDEDTASERKRRWWIGAIILAVVAIAAIVYYYWQNGGLRLFP